jgi:hypothetical protein
MWAAVPKILLLVDMTNAWNVKFYGRGMVIGGKRLSWKKDLPWFAAT